MVCSTKGTLLATRTRGAATASTRFAPQARVVAVGSNGIVAPRASSVQKRDHAVASLGSLARPKFAKASAAGRRSRNLCVKTWAKANKAEPQGEDRAGEEAPFPSLRRPRAPHPETPTLTLSLSLDVLAQRTP